MQSRIEHLVLLRLKEKHAAKDWKSIKSTFLQLGSSIPGILDISIGENISPSRSNGYTHALRVLFDSEESLRSYADHPNHVAFIKILPFDEGEGKPPRTCAVDFKLD